MKPLAQLSRQLPDTAALQELANELENKYTVQDAPAQTTNLCFYDSFDWRLYTAQLLCFTQNNRLYLTDLTGREVTPPVPITAEKIDFHHKLPASALRQTIAPILKMRTLLLQSYFFQTNQSLRILNKDEKTVVMVTLSQMRGERGKNDDPICSVQLHEVRGYEKWFHRLTQDLDNRGHDQPCTKEQDLKNALAITGQRPKDYSSKFAVTLQPEMDSLTAAKTIYTDLLATMQKNEQGILNDLDSEFLHDFRVAIRRTRSGFDMMKKVMAPTVRSRFKKEFRFLGKITGPVRDLDVYLLMEEDYKACLPDHLQKGLRYFFDDLSAQREKEQKKLVQALQSSRYKTIIKDWKKYLQKKKKDEAAASTKPIAEVANSIIWKRFKRVLRDGQAIDANSPDKSLHRLRIQGKKLRYSLEFFTSLYPPKEMKRLIKQLKKLQNNLGLFNDLSVQQDMLNTHLGSLKPGSGKAKKMGAAIGGLLTNLYHEQQQVRCEFEETFRSFSAQKNISLYENLFKGEL